MLCCPACGAELRTTYLVNTPIKNTDHPTGRCSGDGIGRVGVIDNRPKVSHEQQKIRNTQAAVSKNAAHHEQQSAKVFGDYQTAHHNKAIQEGRVDKAKTLKLGGHASRDSNSKQNSNTTKGLNLINKK